VVPGKEAGFRIQLTAANTPDQVDHLLTVLQEVDDHFGLRRPYPSGGRFAAAQNSYCWLVFRT
jgi:hypothetical protein